MAVHQLQRTIWQPYFDRVSRGLGAQFAEIEVAGLQVGDQIEDAWTALNGLVYDPSDDVLEVITEYADHLIYHPRDIYVDETGVDLVSVDVIDGNGTHRIVKLKKPLELPAP